MINKLTKYSMSPGHAIFSNDDIISCLKVNNYNEYLDETKYKHIDWGDILLQGNQRMYEYQLIGSAIPHIVFSEIHEFKNINDKTEVSLIITCYLNDDSSKNTQIKVDVNYFEGSCVTQVHRIKFGAQYDLNNGDHVQFGWSTLESAKMGREEYLKLRDANKIKV